MSTDPLKGFACIVRGHCWVPRHTSRGYYQQCFHCGRVEYPRRNVA